MSKPNPPPPNEVPETSATYERSNPDNALKREDAGKPGASGATRPGVQDDATARKNTAIQTSETKHASPLPAGGMIDGSMRTEEPLGWDQAPTDIKDPRQQRQPRPDGVGGSEPDSAKRDPQR